MISIIEAAGWPIWPLLACSVVALAVVVERLLALRRAVVAPRQLGDEVLTVVRSGMPSAEVVGKLADNSLLGGVLAAGLRHAMTEPRFNEAALRGVLEHSGRSAVHRLESHLNALGTVASSAPLLGLLGTVIGMIELFGAQAPTGGAANPALLAHGISVALYNTAFGLIIAIPSLMFYRHFRARVDAYALEMEQAADRMVSPLLRYSRAK